jgi:predicted amidohydrolase
VVLSRQDQTPASIAIWVNRSNIGENVRVTALKGAEILLAPHQTGGCDSPDPHTMGLVDKKLWENRHADPAAIEAELRGPKGRGWLMRWLPARAHDNGLFLVYSNGVGVDDNEIRTGNAMGVDPPLHPDVATLRFPDFGITRAGRAGC